MVPAENAAVNGGGHQAALVSRETGRQHCDTTHQKEEVQGRKEGSNSRKSSHELSLLSLSLFELSICWWSKSLVVPVLCWIVTQQKTALRFPATRSTRIRTLCLSALPGARQ